MGTNASGRRRLALGLVFVLLCAALVTASYSAGAATVAGVPMSPVVVGLQRAAALRWVAPADVGSPALSGYRVEMNDGSGWVPTRPDREVEAMGAGAEHSCALLRDGTVKCWGRNDFGQLGLGDTQNRGDQPGEMGDNLPAVDLGTGRTAVALAVGSVHTCALLDDGSVKCWGDNENGQLGLGDTQNRGDGPGEMGDNLPTVDLGTGRTAVAIAATAGSYEVYGQNGLTRVRQGTCALLDNGSVKCWGYNDIGQLGLEDVENRGDQPGEMGDNLPAVDLGTGRTAVAISMGTQNTCAILDDGGVKCWGDFGLGYAGAPTYRGPIPRTMGDNLPEINLGPGHSAAAIAVASNDVCVVLDDGSVKCFGISNQDGDNSPAIDLGTGRTATAISASDGEFCAILDEGSLKCWGQNDFGQSGQGDTTTRSGNDVGDTLPAVDLGAGRRALAVSIGPWHGCAFLDDTSLKCWGYNAYGQLGLGDTANRGDEPGEMGDNLPPVELATTSGAAPATAAVLPLALGSYQFRVIAVNDAGDSAPSTETTPLTLGPVAATVPRDVTVVPGDEQVDVTWAQPIDDGGSAITDYEVRAFAKTGGAPTGVDDPAQLVGSTTTHFTFTGLTNVTEYRFGVAAITAIGVGSRSPLSPAAAPGRLPGVPTALAGTSGADRTTQLSWQAPVDDVGQPIIAYRVQVYSGQGGAPVLVTGPTTRLCGATLTCGFGGLHNNVGYRFRVAAVTSFGTGNDSPLSAVVTPLPPGTVPRPPTAVSGNPGINRVALRWVAPAISGSSPIKNYKVSVLSSTGGAPSGVTGATSRIVGSATTSYTFTGLTNGTAYRFRVAAMNTDGTGAPSSQSSAFIAGAPGAPTNVKAVTGATTTTTGPLTVTFTLGAANGSAITSQTATCTSTNGGVTQTGTHTGAAAAPIVVAGATTGKTYTCTVVASSRRGAGALSASSLAAIVGTPAVPTNAKTASGATTTTTGPLTVTFTLGVANGSAITSQTATCVSNNGGVTVTGTHTGATAAPIVVNGATTDKTYTCTVSATNSRGTSPASASSPRVVTGSPAEPTSVSVQNLIPGVIGISFTRGDDNGSPVIGVTATCTSSNGGKTVASTDTGSSLFVAGLTVGKTYRCTITATNLRGTGRASAPSAVFST
jgi:alpha-tubulin suppressor-like RCC1 family protein